MNYRVVVEARQKPESDGLLFGFASKGSSTNTDWVGAVYVKAGSPEEAEREFNAFFREHATKWSFDGKAEPVEAPEEWPLDLQVIAERDLLWRFEQGEVVAGFGL